jgi:hypothetical protein
LAFNYRLIQARGSLAKQLSLEVEPNQPHEADADRQGHADKIKQAGQLRTMD